MRAIPTVDYRHWCTLVAKVYKKILANGRETMSAAETRPSPGREDMISELLALQVWIITIIR